MPSISQGRPNQKITSPNTCFSGALKHTGINQFYKNLMQDLRLPLPLPIKNHTYYVDGQTFKNNCKALSDAIYALPHRANLHNELKEYDHITCDIYKRTPSLNETIQDGLSIIQTSISLRNRLESWIAEGEANEQRSEAVNRIVNAVKNNETELNLSNLGLTTVPPDIGLFLPELNVLDLSHNQLTQVNETMIDQLTHLNDIQLIGNQLISLPDNIKKHYENDTNKIINYYKTWVLSGTPNERRTEAVDRIVNAVKNNETTLNLSGLQLTAIPPDIGLFLPELKKLDLSYNINCDVDFSYNRRKNLPANIFQSLKNLTDLNLMGFDLVTTPDCNIFQSLTKLERLNLGFNRLKNLPANLFQSLTNLRILDLSHNKIERLDATIFQSLQNLEGLSIRENRLTNLDATIFQSLINLKCLLINDNPLTTIPPTVFESLTNLNELELNNNRLVRFELSADARTALQNARVNLQSNQLNAHTVQSLIEAQNAPGYVGPQYWLSIHDPNAISTVAITCQDLPRLVALWRNINNHEPLSTLNAMAIFLARLWRGCTGENDDESSQNIHPQWASLAHRSALNNMAIFLARLWNECPRDANHEIPTSTRTMVQ
ncbi:MAG: leucine-rich repeat domain-containing protein, partial [Candidatus Marinamargulisbacteria bacterium]